MTQHGAGPFGRLTGTRADDFVDPPKTLDVETAARKVIQRWMKLGMLRFSTYDDGSDDLLLAAEIARLARGD